MTQIDPTAQVDRGAVIGKNVSIGPFCRIGPDVKIGDDCRLESHVSIVGDTTIGPRTVISPFASLGGAPQSVHYKGEKTKLIVGSDCLIREYVTMNIGTAAGHGVTRVGNHGFFMANAHIGHDATIGDHVILAVSAVIGGFGEVGDYAFFGCLSGLHQYNRVGAHAMVGAQVWVSLDIVPFAYAIGHRAELAGINRVGLMRRGFSGGAIRGIRNGYRAIFYGAGTLAQRVEAVAKDMPDDANVMEMVDFIRTAKARRVATPRTTGDDGGE